MAVVGTGLRIYGFLGVVSFVPAVMALLVRRDFTFMVSDARGYYAWLPAAVIDHRAYLYYSYQHEAFDWRHLALWQTLIFSNEFFLDASTHPLRTGIGKTPIDRVHRYPPRDRCAARPLAGELRLDAMVVPCFVWRTRPFSRLVSVADATLFVGSACVGFTGFS